MQKQKILDLLNCPDDDKFKNVKFDKANKKILKILRDKKISFDDKSSILAIYFNYMQNDAEDYLSIIRDYLRYLRDNDLLDMINYLKFLSKSSNLRGYHRCLIAVSLYNQMYLGEAQECFQELALDNECMLEYRIEACRYLYGSDVEELKEISQQVLNEVINDLSYPSEYRYKIIMSFTNKRYGIKSFFNTSKIRVPYDEDYIYTLQFDFFTNDKNEVESRILSGQFLLGMESIDTETKNIVCEILYKICCDNINPHNIRADAADVLSRLGSEDYIEKGRNIIQELGYSEIDRSKGPKIKTIYNDAENVHRFKIDSIVDNFMKKVKQSKLKNRSYQDVWIEICDMIRSKNLPPSNKFLTMKALNRISVDTATFSPQKVTMAEILLWLWIIVQSYESEKRDFLYNRIIDELMDMANTCSTGHASRLINVLSCYDNYFTISYDEQITSNIAGRMNAFIRDCPDEKIKESLGLGMLDDADEDDRCVYLDFVHEKRDILYDELFDEFVDKQLISKDEFDKIFEKGFEMYLLK